MKRSTFASVPFRIFTAALVVAAGCLTVAPAASAHATESSTTDTDNTIQTNADAPDADPDAANDAAAAAWYERNPEPTPDLSAYQDGNYGWAAAPRSDAASPDGVSSGGPVPGSALWAACGLTTPQTKIVKSYSRVAVRTGGVTMPSGTSNLLCGTANYGYFHIVKEHLSQWENDASVENINWRDLAHWEIGLALSAPGYVSYRASSDTLCYSHQIYLVNRVTGQIVATRWPTIVIARSSGKIITAFPSTNISC